MNKFEEIIKMKKQKSTSRKPRYGTRKLSIGLVSCVLGYAMLVSPSIAMADEANNQPVVEENLAPKGLEDTNPEVETEPTKKEEEAQTDTPAEILDEEDKTQNDEKSPEKNTKTSEKPAEVKLLTLNQYNANENDLGISEEVSPLSLMSSEAEATPISSETGVIKNVEITIGGSDNGEKTTTVNPTANEDRIDSEDTDLNLKTRIDFDIPEGTKSGSTFDILISDNVNFNGIVKEEKIKAIEYNGDEIATGEKLDDGRRGYKYTFNDKIDDLTDIRVRLEYPLFIDPKEVPGDSAKESVKVTLAGEDGTVIGENSKDFAVEYEKGVFEVDPEAHTVTVSGSANITNVTENTYNHVIYVNPTGDQGLTGSHLEIKNQEYEEKFTDDYGNEQTRKKAYDGAIFDEEVKNSVKVFKIKDKDHFNLSYDLEESNLEDVTEKANVKLIEDIWGGPSYLKVDVNQENLDDSVYVVTYNGKRKPNQATKTNVWFTAESRQMEGYDTARVTDTNGGWHWTNDILFDDPKTVAEANKVYNLGDRVWIDANKNGIQYDDETGLADVEVTLKGDDILPVTIKTDAEGKYLFKKLKDGSYTVEFTVPDGYEPTTANATMGTDENNSDASVAQGAAVATATAKINNAHNMNVDFGVIKTLAKKGSFKETHVYKTLDYYGNVIGDKTITEAGKSSEGTKDKTYDSSKVDKDGYVFTKVSANQGSDEVRISEDGKSVEAGNYVEDKELAVTYEYVKQPGRFIEHHIYRTIDKDGNVTEEKVDGKITGGTEKMTYTTGKVDKDGFTFIETKDAKEDPTFNDKGESTTGNFKPGVKQEITYVYEKKETPWIPLEPATPIKAEDPKPVVPVTPEDPEEPTPVVPTTPIDPEEPTPIIPAEPIEDEPGRPVENEDKPVIKIKNDEKTTEVSKKTDEEVIETEAKEVVKMPARPKNGNPKTGVASSLGVMATLAASALAFVGLDDKKRKNK